MWDKLGADSNWTIELNNHTLNFTGDWFGDSDLTAVTFRNGTVNCVRLLRCRTPVTLTFDHVVLTSTAMFLNLRGNSTINIIASTITSNGQDCIYVAPLGSTITFNLTEGSSWIRNGGVNSYTSALISTDGATGAGANTLNMNVDGTSTIKLAHTDLAADHYFVNSDGDKSEISLNVTLASGANVVFAAESAGNNLISNMPNTTITDNGANWKVLGKTLKNGVTLPSVSIADKTLIGWSINGALAKIGGSYSNSEVENATLYSATPVTVEASDFYMRNGASIRLASAGGIRFETVVSTDLLAMLGGNVSFGTIIAPTARAVEDGAYFMTINATEGYFVDITQTKWGEEESGYKAFYGALTDIPVTASGVTTALSGRAYMKITYSDSTTGYIYTTYTAENNSRTLLQVAQAAYAAGLTDNNTVNTIIAAGGNS